MKSNSMTAPITIEDIRNPARKSGFSHVGSASSPGNVAGGKFYWRAQRNGATGQGLGSGWKGPTRRTASEAAQDYCDYVNGQNLPTPATLRTAGHAYNIEDSDRDPDVEAALGVLRDWKAQRAGRQGYVYCITDGEYLKVGYSVNPSKRVAELQTGNARILRVIGTIPGTPADEKRLHTKYIEQNVLQEWFELDSDLLAEFMEEEPHA